MWTCWEQCIPIDTTFLSLASGWLMGLCTLLFTETMLWFLLPSINSINNGWAWGIVPIMRKEELWRHNTNLLSKNAFRVSMTTLWAATNLPYQEGWVGRWFKISKNCPVGRNKITTEWLDIWSWELCKLVKSLHTTPGHPKHQLTWGEKLLASIVSSLQSCHLA